MIPHLLILALAYAGIAWLCHRAGMPRRHAIVWPWFVVRGVVEMIWGKG